MNINELERIAYINGSALAGIYADLGDAQSEQDSTNSEVDNALDLVGCAGLRGKQLYAALHDISQQAQVLSAALMAVSVALESPGAIGKKRLVKMSDLLCELVATPDAYNDQSIKKAVYETLS